MNPNQITLSTTTKGIYLLTIHAVGSNFQEPQRKSEDFFATLRKMNMQEINQNTWLVEDSENEPNNVLRRILNNTLIPPDTVLLFPITTIEVQATPEILSWMKERNF